MELVIKLADMGKRVSIGSQPVNTDWEKVGGDNVFILLTTPRTLYVCSPRNLSVMRRRYPHGTVLAVDSIESVRINGINKEFLLRVISYQKLDGYLNEVTFEVTNASPLPEIEVEIETVIA